MNPTENQRIQFEHERKYHDLLLAESDPEKRRALYADAYGILYRDFFHEESGQKEFGAKSHYTEMMRRWATGRTIVDIGCGLGEATIAFARFAQKAIGLEVDQDVVDRCNKRFHEAGHSNASAKVFNGTILPFADSSIDLIYSNNVFEHLHPDDALTQTRDVYRVLKPGGRVVIITPSWETRPHDISKFFLPPGSEAQGLHLKEYTLAEIGSILTGIGFRNPTQPWIAPNRLMKYRMIFLHSHLQRSVKLSLWLQRSPLRRSGFLTGHLCLDNIIISAIK